MIDTPEIDRLYTIGENGRRNFLHPASVSGPYSRRRRAIGIVLMVLLAVLPFIELGGAPGIWLDVEHRRFHVLGLHFAPSDSYLLFFLLTGVAFTLVVASALWGRIWCGYACPQTVFLDGLYRPIERLFEGSREQQLRLDKSAWNANKIARKGGKHVAFFVLSTLLAHLFVCYFVSAPVLSRLVLQGPAAEPGVFAWASVVTLLLYGNFAWFREQLCIIICPYGRLQSALSDRDTVVVGYDERRGEPRGKKGVAKGDCIDCRRCIAVCPTGIDIRHGMQLECVGCTACIDACDDVMLKLGKPRGLIRYDSQRGLAGEPRKLWRPRLALYGLLLGAGLIATTLALHLHRPYSLTLARQPGPPFVLDGENVRNVFVLKAENTTDATHALTITADLPPDARLLTGGGEMSLELGVSRHAVVIVAPRSLGGFDFSLGVTSDDGKVATLRAHFAAP